MVEEDMSESEVEREPTDETLVYLAQSRNDDAFALLIARYRSSVFARTSARLRDHDDAEDATQETWVLAYRHLGDLRAAHRFGGWLHSIAERVAFKYLRKRRLQENRTRPLEEWMELADSSNHFEADEGKRNRYLACDVRAALGTLSPPHRAVATLFYLVKLTQQDIATLLGIPLGTVKSRLNRSRLLILRRLNEMTTTQNKVSQDDYGRAVIAGMRGVIHWQTLLPANGLEGWRNRVDTNSPAQGNVNNADNAWRRTGDVIIGADHDGSAGRLVSGDQTWSDYELSLLVTPISGGNAQVHFRIAADGQHYYMLDLLMGWQAVAISRVDLSQESKVQKLSVVNFPLGNNQEYDVLIAARGASLTSYIDGQLVNQVTDFSHHAGPIALNVWESQTAFRDPRIRLLS